MTRAKAEKIRKGIEDKIRCNTVDMEEWAEYWGFTEDEYDEFLDMAIEALQQRPIIHCKDCKFNTGKSKCFNPNSAMLFPDDDDFCSYAERMESEK